MSHSAGEATTEPTPAEDPAPRARQPVPVDAAIFRRFRAAIYRAGRDPDAVDQVQQSASAAIESLMLEKAQALEARWNGGQPFRSPGPVRRPGRKSA